MIIDLPNLEQLDKFINEHDALYFRLTGGLGNQLFGLSEAFGIHRNTGRAVVIDVGAIEHILYVEPEWMEWSKKQDWLILVRIPKEISSEFALTNLGDGTTRINISDNRYYTGWKFSLKRVRSAGLFKEGEFPFKSESVRSTETVVHYRVGDYASAAGIGVLQASFYVRAINSISDFGEIEFFSDDNDSAQELINHLRITSARISSSVSAIEVLSQISSAKCIVAANSTLSWWGIYFSRAEKVICPKPFYLQDWEFDFEARFNNAIYISRFKNMSEAMVNWLVWKLRSINIRNKK